jgi:hypothetical protein
VSIKNCCNRPIIKNCYLEKGIAFTNSIFMIISVEVRTFSSFSICINCVSCQRLIQLGILYSIFFLLVQFPLLLKIIIGTCNAYFQRTSKLNAVKNLYSRVQ